MLKNERWSKKRRRKWGRNDTIIKERKKEEG
jgi:hypothetical protein